MKTEQEQVWVLRACRGDQEAFTRLVEAYQLPVYNLAYRMLGGQAEAEDATQETFLRAYTRLDSYDPSRKFSSWILSIASHYCVDRLRRRHGLSASTDDEEMYHWIPDDHPKPEEQALEHEQRDQIHHTLSQLPPQYRLVIILRYWHDMPYDEIAQLTQTTESAVKSRLHRARAMMALKLNEAREANHAKQASRRRMTENAMSQSF